MLRNNQKLLVAIRILKNKWVKRLLGTVVVGVSLLFLLMVFLFYVEPRISFWYHTKRCGHYPVITTNFMGVPHYWIPEFGKGCWEEAFGIFPPSGYFCKEEEAWDEWYIPPLGFREDYPGYREYQNNLLIESSRKSP
jgi:hypothetical protein